jgi:RHS repeat-associated protein
LGSQVRVLCRGAARQVGAAVAVALVVLAVAAPAPQAALSPAPYLDPAYNTALWNEVLNTGWPSGYPSSTYITATYGISEAAATEPYLGRFAADVGGITVPSSGSYSAGWKIVRSADTQWLQVSGDVGSGVTSTNVRGEAWCVYGGTCYGAGAGYGSAYGTNGRDLILGVGITGCTLFNMGVGGFVAQFTDGGFDRSTPASYIACNDAVNAAFNGVGGGGAKLQVSAATCNGTAGAYFGSHWTAGAGGTCSIHVWHGAESGLIHSLPVPYTNQSVNAVTTWTTPSQSTGLANARPAITSAECGVQNEYNGSLDPTNWAAPDSASCGGPIAAPVSQTYGPTSCGSQHEPYGFATIAVNTSCGSGEPVDMATGSFYTGSVDVSLPGIGVPFVFTRSYNSADPTSGPLGPGWTDSLNWTATVGTGGDVTLRSGTGQQLHFTDNSGTYAPDAGGRARLTASGGGYTLVTHDETSYVFNSSGQLTGETDRNGQGLALAYDGSGDLASVTGSGRTVTLTSSGGLLTGISLPDGRSVSYGYTGGRLTSFTDLRGNTISYTYDSGGRLATIVDQNGHTVVSNTYDPSTGRVSGQTDARGHASSYGWNPSTGTATYTDANGHTWSQAYVNNTLRSETDPLGHTVTYSYNGDLNLTAVKDPRGNTTSMTWGINGNMLTRTAPAPLSYTESWVYDTKNDVTGYTDGRGHTTTYGFDTAGNLTSATLPNPTGSGVGPETTFGRNPTTGLVTSITDPRGKQTTFGYDSAGDLTSVTTPLGHETTYGYDSAGRMTSKVDPRGNVTGANPADYTWTYGYDAANHPTTVTDPLGDQTQWSYDPVGNLKKFTDANSNATSYAYDNANNLTIVTAPDTTTTTYAYDNNGNLTSKIDANNHTTTYAYDNANRLSSIVKPGGETWTYTYDADNSLATMVDGNGNATHSGGTTTYGYDALDRLTSIGYSGTATPNVTYSYDGDGNRTQMTDGAGTATYNYDNDNRLTTVARGSQTFGYGYDANSNLTSETYPDSTAITYSYTDDEQLASVASGGNTTSYSYDPAGNLLTTTLPSGNGYTQTRTYDKAGRLTDLSNANSSATLSAFAYSLDPVGKPTEVDQTGATSSTTTYGYDTLNRLTSATVGGATTSWTYDGVGNRLTQTTPSGTTNYTYNTDDELTAAGTTSYSYDANGNQTAVGSNPFTYDLANRLVSTSVGSTTTSYSFDGDGNRLTSNDGTSTTNYLWDPLAPIPQLDVEQNGSGTDLRSYLYGAGLVSMTTGGSTYYYHSDGLGSIANVTDSNGSPQWTYSYDAWGDPTATQDASAAPTNLIQFVAGYADPTGLELFGARQYDSTTGRFLTTDPANLATGSTYAYVDDQPTSATDPTGFGLLHWIKTNIFQPYLNYVNAGVHAVECVARTVAPAFTDFGTIASEFILAESACYIAGVILAPETGGAALVGAAVVCGVAGVIEIQEIRKHLEHQGDPFAPANPALRR